MYIILWYNTIYYLHYKFDSFGIFNSLRLSSLLQQTYEPSARHPISIKLHLGEWIKYFYLVGGHVACAYLLKSTTITNVYCILRWYAYHNIHTIFVVWIDELWSNNLPDSATCSNVGKRFFTDELIERNTKINVKIKYLISDLRIIQP